ncbi:ubiquitin binding protein [Ascodesmis nigricans]|uniref:Vacuolar protein sorting-associated protein 27 n=1 Tax=Ascodesmis nigricans TaxID=341454 RepID=A0A4S2MSZ5_9PEZI|nr:ubiquitin binding protein [Ascodesmis nigricans]
MSSWFGSSSSSNLDEQVEKATASSLEDIALNLEISDIIRSKTVQPKDAMRSLKRRIGHVNPNVQLAALNLTDTCVKNGGNHFLVEIASREFMDNLLSLLRAPGAVNSDVRAKILELIQTWSSAFEGKPNLKYVGEVYHTLKSEGYNFPPPIKVSSTFVDSSAPPEWTDADICMRCRTAFTFTNRKHHCRNCGSVFCGSCSSKTLPLPHLGIVQAVRVCDGCHTKLTEKRHVHPSSKPHQVLHQAPAFHKPMPTASVQPRNARVEQDDDEDFRRALELSLEDAQKKGILKKEPVTERSSAVSHTSTKPNNQVKPPANDEEEDEELKAAIAASLRDMEEQKARSAWSNPARFTESAPKVAPVLRSDHELSPQEAENINLFSTLVDRLQTQPPGTILREPQIQELYESIGSLRPKLARTFGETMSKFEALDDMYGKLDTVIRYYNQMLEARLRNALGRHGMELPPQAATYPNSQSGNPYPTPINPPVNQPPIHDRASFDPHGYYTNQSDSGVNPSAPQPSESYYTNLSNPRGNANPPQPSEPPYAPPMTHDAPSTPHPRYYNNPSGPSPNPVSPQSPKPSHQALPTQHPSYYHNLPGPVSNPSAPQSPPEPQYPPQNMYDPSSTYYTNRSVSALSSGPPHSPETHFQPHLPLPQTQQPQSQQEQSYYPTLPTPQQQTPSAPPPQPLYPQQQIDQSAGGFYDAPPSQMQREREGPKAEPVPDLIQL